MSIGELVVIIIIAILVMKPEDVIGLLKNIKKLKNHLNKFQQDFFAQFIENTEKNYIHDVNDLELQAKQLNFYLKKIVDIEGNYDGIYSLPELKKKYEELTEKEDTNNS